jgi:glycosyltransferase involved in cell wall biosynthesis
MDEEKIKGTVFEKAEIYTSFIQSLPFSKKKYRYYLFLFPLAVEQFDLSEYDVILSSSHAVAKGVLTTSNQLHICYCHTPIRYAWDLYHEYLRNTKLSKGVKGFIAKLILHYLRIWDLTTANRVDYFIANSKYVARRIKKIYGRDSAVIYPPVDIDKFELETEKENFYLTASRLVPYKRVDLIVEAFSNTDRKLIVVGDGPDMDKIKKKAGKNVEILGYQPDEILVDLMRKAKAFIFAAEEDFGITPVEAQACGTPVICLGKGGTKETVIDMITGIYFQEQTVESILKAVEKFERNMDSFDPKIIRKNALKFSRERFEREIESFVKEKYNEFIEQKL